MKLRKVLRIARWEVTKNAGGVDRKTIAVAAIALLAAGLVAPYAATQGIALDRGIYRVGVSEESPYHQVVADDPTFVAREPSEDALEDEEIDVLVPQFGPPEPAESVKGEAALSELRSTVKQYNDRQMRQEPNRSAAFPVAVTLQYVEREQVQDVIAPGRTGSSETGDDTDQTDEETGSDTGGADGEQSGDGTEAGADGSVESPQASDGDTVAGGGGGNVGGLAGALAGGNASGTPADISPPFPFQSLVLAFLFVLPLNFIIQAYGSTMLSERLNRRGELLLVSPVTRFDIIGGKTLPYFGAAITMAALIAGGLQFPDVSPLSVGTSVLAITPIALLFLAATFVGAMFARSFKELTFVTVTVTVSLTTYAFVPAIFTDVGAVALISPLTIVVRNLQGQAVTLSEFAFSTLPPTLTAGVLFALGAGIYREEDMFTQRSIPLKVLDALAARIRGKWSVAAVSALLLPFVFVTELIGVAMLFAIPEALSVPAILVIVVVVEEIAKSLHVYAGYAHSRFEAGLTPALIAGAFSGLGFFVGEKLTLLAQLVSLPDQVLVGQAALATGTGAGAPSIPVVIAFLLAPLLLHVVTAAISAVGASRNRRTYAVALVIAMAIHFGYNFTVVSASGAF
ncbi:PrsW family intramembrane metalloprotease [Halorientalis brevis]|uniref:PrsW family intramembrane metalloprotease n=1 Tax=Halorientalis brevis TaxID=1126241 RepID=A0ABD6CFK2_9EURY